MVKFHVSPIKIETDIESAKKTVKDAVALLLSPIPKSASGCEYCKLVENRKNE